MNKSSSKTDQLVMEFFPTTTVTTTVTEVVHKSNPIGLVIQISKWLAPKISRRLKLSVQSFAWEVIQVVAETEKAYLIKARIPDVNHSLSFCRACGSPLTSKFSIITGMGESCAKKWGVAYVTKTDSVDAFKARLQAKIDSIGVIEFWVPKKCIKRGSIDLVKATAPNKKTIQTVVYHNGLQYRINIVDGDAVAQAYQTIHDQTYRVNSLMLSGTSLYGFLDHIAQAIH